MAPFRQFAILGLLTFACSLSSAEEKLPPLKVLQSGAFRVLYYTEGALAIDPTDANENGIPDRAEDILKSNVAAWMLFCQLLDYPDPFNSSRRKKPDFLDIRLDVPTAGHTSSKAERSKDIPGNPPNALSYVIHYSPKTRTHPSAVGPHEFFHQIQYAAAHFRASWYMEGTANWASGQKITRTQKDVWSKTTPLDHWPLTSDETEKLFEMTYSARDFFWNRLALLCDDDGEIPRGPVFEKLRAMKYSDGSPVIRDTKLVGWRLMRDVLLELGKIEDKKETRKDNALILRTIEKAVAKHLPENIPGGADIAAEKIETKIHQAGGIRVFYQTSGMDAVKPADLNTNGIPDQVEDALTQATAARILYVELLGFPDPLRAKCFRKARHIDIHFVNEKTTFFRLRGRTPVVFPKDIHGKPSPRGSLVIKCKRSSNIHRSSVLTQDFFYLVGQAGTPINRWWCLGGMGAWSGFGLSSARPRRTTPLEKWPLPPDMAQKLFGARADSANFFWNPLVERHDDDGEIPRGPAFEKLRTMKYVNGTPVLKSTNIPGWRLMREILTELGTLKQGAENQEILRTIEKVVAQKEAASN